MNPVLAQEPYCTEQPTADDLIKRRQTHEALIHERDKYAYTIVGALSAALEDEPERWSQYRQMLLGRLQDYQDAAQTLEQFQRAHKLGGYRETEP